MNSAGAVWVRKKRQCAGVDNNHTKMLSAVTAYYQIRTRNRLDQGLNVCCIVISVQAKGKQPKAL